MLNIMRKYKNYGQSIMLQYLYTSLHEQINTCSR